jgi:hypothetical protein
LGVHQRTLSPFANAGFGAIDPDCTACKFEKPLTMLPLANAGFSDRLGCVVSECKFEKALSMLALIFVPSRGLRPTTEAVALNAYSARVLEP